MIKTESKTRTGKATNQSRAYELWKELNVAGATFHVYGTSENPLFSACDIANINNGNICEFMDSLEDTERKLIYVPNEKGRYSAVWAITMSGLERVMNSGYISDGDVYLNGIRASLGDDQQKYTITEMLNNPEFMISMLNKLKETQGELERVSAINKEVHEVNKELLVECKARDKKISELEPKAEYYDKVLSCKDAISISVIAKEYGKSATWLNNWLHKHNVQYKLDGLWVLYARYADKGYTCTKTTSVTDEFGNTHSKIHTYWTEAGREFIFKKLKKAGIEPISK